MALADEYSQAELHYMKSMVDVRMQHAIKVRCQLRALEEWMPWHDFRPPDRHFGMSEWMRLVRREAMMDEWNIEDFPQLLVDRHLAGVYNVSTLSRRSRNAKHVYYWFPDLEHYRDLGFETSSMSDGPRLWSARAAGQEWWDEAKEPFIKQAPRDRFPDLVTYGYMRRLELGQAEVRQSDH